MTGLGPPADGGPPALPNLGQQHHAVSPQLSSANVDGTHWAMALGPRLGLSTLDFPLCTTEAMTGVPPGVPSAGDHSARTLGSAVLFTPTQVCLVHALSVSLRGKGPSLFQPCVLVTLDAVPLCVVGIQPVPLS